MEKVYSSSLQITCQNRNQIENWDQGFSRERSRSFPLIIRPVLIPIKILKKDLNPGFSDPLVQSSNSLLKGKEKQISTEKSSILCHQFHF